ncbi:MAG: DUF6440 family protein [Oscillospiraceae bacterium]|jgi:hypothetical protein|nr:DUF6440 family protein [Oscillospiraceae bacterium]
MVLVIAGAIIVMLLLCGAALALGLRTRRRLNRRSQQGQQHPLGVTELLDAGRLQIIHRSGGWHTPRREIYRDEHTGVQYLMIGAAITPMLDRDGKPLAEKEFLPSAN